MSFMDLRVWITELNFELELYYYFQQIYKDNLHNPRIALANLGGYQ